MITLPKINPKYEVDKITSFLKKIQKQTGISKVVLGLSGGIDSTTVYYLLKKTYKAKNIISVSLPYKKIKPIIDSFLKGGSIRNFLTLLEPPRSREVQNRKKFISSPPNQKIRIGNIMARVRMIILFDLAKKNNALVCGTENKSEKLLGYFTRFGDSASDIEPISHLYKTQVYELAKYLRVPEKIIKAKPTAGLWSGQTDEGEFGFTYKEADQVLHLYFEKKYNLEKIKKLGFVNAPKIIKRTFNNQFKQQTPYHL